MKFKKNFIVTIDIGGTKTNIGYFENGKLMFIFQKMIQHIQKIILDAFLWIEAMGLYPGINFQNILLLRSCTILKSLKTLLLIVSE